MPPPKGPRKLGKSLRTRMKMPRPRLNTEAITLGCPLNTEATMLGYLPEYLPVPEPRYPPPYGVWSRLAYEWLHSELDDWHDHKKHKNKHNKHKHHHNDND